MGVVASVHFSTDLTRHSRTGQEAGTASPVVGACGQSAAAAVGKALNPSWISVPNFPTEQALSTWGKGSKPCHSSRRGQKKKPLYPWGRWEETPWAQIDLTDNLKSSQPTRLEFGRVLKGSANHAARERWGEFEVCSLKKTFSRSLRAAFKN